MKCFTLWKSFPSLLLSTCCLCLPSPKQSHIAQQSESDKAMTYLWAATGSTELPALWFSMQTYWSRTFPREIYFFPCYLVIVLFSCTKLYRWWRNMWLITDTHVHSFTSLCSPCVALLIELKREQRWDCLGWKQKCCKDCSTMPSGVTELISGMGYVRTEHGMSPFLWGTS